MTVSSTIAIFTAADGALALLAPEGAALRAGQASVSLPADYSDDVHEWSATLRRMVESPAKLDAKLTAEVKAAAEQRKMRFLTPGGAKKTEYAEKRAEVIEWDKLGTTVAAIALAFDKMPPGTRAFLFAHAIEDSKASGDTPADAIARFRAGLARSAVTATISALEARACALIKAAPTAAGKRAAAAVAWPS